MGKLAWSRKFCVSCIKPSTHDDEQPSTSGMVHTLDYSLLSVQKMDLRNLCDEIFMVLDNTEVAKQENKERMLLRAERQFWPRLAHLPVVGRPLQELFTRRKPNFSVLETYFPKGENDTTTLAYLIFRDVSRDLRLAVGLLSLGASMENWATIDDEQMKDECLDAFRQMCRLAKLLYELKDPMTPSSELQQELHKGEEFLVEGSIMCSIHAHGLHLRRLLWDCSYRESLWWLLDRMNTTSEALCSLSERLIFRGIRSSPLSGRPGMIYPQHAVGIEREVNKITEMLEWKSMRKFVTVIVSGPAGIGKTTLADAVFTSLHIPLCNYTRYTCFDAAPHDRSCTVRGQDWTRYFWVKKDNAQEVGNNVDQDRTEKNQETDDDDDMEKDTSSSDEEYYQESEPENKEDDDYKQHGKHKHDDVKRQPVDLVSLELEAAARVGPDVCRFIYFDNATSGFSNALRRVLRSEETGKERILITTRDWESTWEECKDMLTEDAMYNYFMTASERPLQESQEIIRSTMSEGVWKKLVDHYSCKFSTTLNKLIAMCEEIPGWLVLTGKYISAVQASSPHTALQYLLSECASLEGDAKWESMTRIMAEDSLQQECIDALQLICHCFQHDFVLYDLHVPGIDEMQDLFEEHVLRILQDRGLLCVTDGGHGCIRVPYPVWRYTVNKSMHMHRIVQFQEEVQKLLEKELLLQTSPSVASVIKVPSIKTLHFHKGIRYEMDASNLLVLAKTLQMFCMRGGARLILKGNCQEIGRASSFDNLIVYHGRPLLLPLHNMARSIRRMIMFLDEDDKQDIFNQWNIPPAVRYLNICCDSSSIQRSSIMEIMAKLSNLRALALDFPWLQTELMMMPLEQPCLSSIQRLTINCDTLYELPQSFGQQLPSLQWLWLTCPGLRRLPQSLGKLPCLKELYLAACKSLQQFCTDFCNLRSLHTLHWQWIELPEDCCKEMLKLKGLRVLVLDPELHDQSKDWCFASQVEMYYTRHFEVYS